MFGLRSALIGGFGHDFLNFIRVARELLAQQLHAGFGDEDIVFNTHAEIFFRDVDAGLTVTTIPGVSGLQVSSEGSCTLRPMGWPKP